MDLSRRLFATTLMAALCSATAGSSEKLGSVHAGTYGDMTFETIDDMTLTYRRIFSNHTYDIEIPNTQTGRMILCQLFDSDGEVAAHLMANSRARETNVHFRMAPENATARCSYVSVERLTRPSGSP